MTFDPKNSRGSFFINLALVLIILSLGAIIALQAMDLQHYLGK